MDAHSMLHSGYNYPILLVVALFFFSYKKCMICTFFLHFQMKKSRKKFNALPLHLQSAVFIHVD